MSERKITRLEAVRNQIDSAIRNYFLWDDLVSATTLAGAAERVMSDMQPQDGIFGVDATSIRSIINLYIKPEHQKEAVKLYRADYDFFRHADRRSENEYVLKEAVVEFSIFITICSYEFLKQPKTHAMNAYVYWFYFKYPHYLKKDNQTFVNLVNMMGEEAKKYSKKEYFEAYIKMNEK